jgi:hypothetical protein
MHQNTHLLLLGIDESLTEIIPNLCYGTDSELADNA